VEWEVVGGQHEIWPQPHGRMVRIRHLVAGPMIGAGVEVTRRAGGPAVASDLHVPEERLAERNEGLGIRDVTSES
jgi:hypothetical protein